MEPLHYGTKDMKPTGRTLAAPEWKGFTGVALATSRHQLASGWDIPASNGAARSLGHERPRPLQGPASPQRKPVTACPQLPLPVRSWALKVSLAGWPWGIYLGTVPGLGLELTEATDSGPEFDPVPAAG